MDFAPSEELQEFLGHVRRYGRDELYPRKEEMIQNRKSWQDRESNLQQLRAENKGRRWWLPQVGEKYGGLGLSVVDHGLLRAKLDKSPFGFYSFNCQAPDAGHIEILTEHGNDLQKNAYLQRLLDGEIRSCFSMTEPEHAGSNPVHMSTSAVKEETNGSLGRSLFMDSGRILEIVAGLSAITVMALAWSLALGIR